MHLLHSCVTTQTLCMASLMYWGVNDSGWLRFLATASLCVVTYLGAILMAHFFSGKTLYVCV